MHRVLSLEEGPPPEKLRKNAANAPHVHRRIVRAGVAEKFRRPIPSRLDVPARGKRDDRHNQFTSIIVIARFSLSMEMSRLTRDGTAEPVSRDQILRHARGQGKIHFPCSADHEQDWQPYLVTLYSAVCDDHTYIAILV